jgi:hypothetical protein
MLFADEWYRFAEFFLFAGDPLAFATDQGRERRLIITMLAASFVAFLFAQLFAHEMISQYQEKRGFVLALLKQGSNEIPACLKTLVRLRLNR